MLNRINPNHLSAQAIKLITNYILAHPNDTLLKENKEYVIGNESFMLDTDASILFYPCHKQKARFHLEFFSEKAPMAEGGLSDIFKPTLSAVISADEFAVKPSKYILKRGLHWLGHGLLMPQGKYSQVKFAEHEAMLTREAGIPVKGPFFVERDHLRKNSFIVMPKYGEQELFDVLADVTKPLVDVDLILTLTLALLEAIEALHEKKIIHQDLKPDNVRVTIDALTQHLCEFQLIDFGLSKKIGEKSKEMCGTINYLAPEVYEGQASTEKRDIFACGLIMIYLFRGGFLTTEHANEAYKLAKNIQMVDLFSDLTDLEPSHGIIIETLLRQMFDPDPEKRPDILTCKKIILDVVLKRRQCHQPEEIKLDLEHAHHEAIKLKAKFIANQKNNAPEAQELLNIYESDAESIEKSLASINDDPIVIEYFFQLLGIKSLFGTQDKQSASAKIENLLATYQDHFANLASIQTRVATLLPDHAETFKGKRLQERYDIALQSLEDKMLGLTPNLENIPLINKKLLATMQKLQLIQQELKPLAKAGVRTKSALTQTSCTLLGSSIRKTRSLNDIDRLLVPQMR